MITCPKCRAEKDESDFSKSSLHDNGPCITCVKSYNQMYREKNKEKIRQKAKGRKYNSETRKKYYQENKEACLARSKQWHLTNKDKVRAHQHKNSRTISSRFRTAKRVADKRHKGWTLTIDQFESIVSLPCHYCDGFFGKVEVGSGLDRLDPNKGYELSNVVSCCYTCNKIKSDVLSVSEGRAVVKLVISMRLNPIVEIV